MLYTAQQINIKTVVDILVISEAQLVKAHARLFPLWAVRTELFFLCVFKNVGRRAEWKENGLVKSLLSVVSYARCLKRQTCLSSAQIHGKTVENQCSGMQKHILCLCFYALETLKCTFVWYAEHCSGEFCLINAEVLHQLDDCMPSFSKVYIYSRHWIKSKHHHFHKYCKLKA